MTEAQQQCAAKGHQPWVFATKTITMDAFGTQTKRVRYCTGCGMDHPSRRKARAKKVPDNCPDCGSDNLFSGHFDADDYGYPLEIGDETPEGVRWTTFCNQCGSEVLAR